MNIEIYAGEQQGYHSIVSVKIDFHEHILLTKQSPDEPWKIASSGTFPVSMHEAELAHHLNDIAFKLAGILSLEDLRSQKDTTCQSTE